VAILNITGDYDCLVEPLNEVTDEIKDIRNIVIDDIEYIIEWFLGTDLKILNLCTGIGATNLCMV